MSDPFECLVFGGGGTRCFWHGGFMETAGDALPLAVTHVSAVSGGALSAAAWITGRERRLLDLMTSAFEEAEDENGNCDVAALFGEGEAFPHQALYRRVVADLLADGGEAEIADGPALDVQLARPGPLGVTAAMLAYGADLKVRSTPHPKAPALTGAEAMVVDGRAAAREGRLGDLIVAAASAPPLFDQHRWDGEPVMDGGVVDNAPVLGDGRALVLVTRVYRNLPEGERNVYFGPSEDPPTFKLDFTDAQGVRDVWDLGRRDGEDFKRRRPWA